MDRFHPLTLTMAREARGFTQSELSEKTGLAQAQISKFELGIRDPGIEALQKIAEALELPTRFFETEPSSYPTPVTFFRKTKGLPVKRVNRIRASMGLDMVRFEILFRSVDFERRTIPRIDCGPNTCSPEDIALNMRNQWNVPDGPIRNMTLLLEEAGILVVFRDYGESNFSGVSRRLESGQWVIFVNETMPGDRIRFTLAHELGHLVMHDVNEGDEAEKQADRFASAFLLPEYLVRHSLHRLTISKLADLKAFWKVSMQALLKRAETLRTIDPQQSRRLWMQMSSMGLRKRELGYIQVELPTLLQEIVNFHLSVLQYTDRDLMNALLCTSDEEYMLYNRAFIRRIGASNIIPLQSNGFNNSPPRIIGDGNVTDRA